MKTKIVISFLYLLCVFVAKAQSDSATHANDSIAAERLNKKHTYSAARKASIMSAILPGLGQVYNKKYWKLPIVYGGLGGFGYMFHQNNKNYQFYRKNYKAIFDEDSTTQNTTLFSADALKIERDTYLKNRNFAAIGFCLVYLLNIIDANVDAHLRTFDVSDDLSLQLDPWQSTYQTTHGYRTVTGLSLKLNFK